MKYLSYVGSLQLIKSVLFSLQSCWCRTFILPKKVIKVKWDLVCKSKCEGGLGLKRVEDWNKAAIMGFIWSLFVQAQSLWVAWVRTNLLKGKSFWKIKITQDCSWGRRKILKLREIARPFIRFHVVSSKNIHLWYNWWHPNGALFLKYGHRIMYDAASSSNAILSSVLQKGNWIWAQARSINPVSIQSKLCLIDFAEEERPIVNIIVTNQSSSCFKSESGF